MISIICTACNVQFTLFASPCSKQAPSSWSPSEDGSSEKKPCKGEYELSYEECLACLLEARLRDNPYHWQVSYEKRIHSLSERLGTSCKSMHRKRGRHRPVPFCTELLSRNTLCWDFWRLGKHQRIKHRGKTPNPRLLNQLWMDLIQQHFEKEIALATMIVPYPSCF